MISATSWLYVRSSFDNWVVK
uniref:Uncharacterized protein n=1 Tax=Rhizophora mucronata TaxID=61149 RepID=A0A2P2QJ07_RHIMU